MLKHPYKLIRDTAHYEPFTRKTRSVSIENYEKLASCVSQCTDGLVGKETTTEAQGFGVRNLGHANSNRRT